MSTSMVITVLASVQSSNWTGLVAKLIQQYGEYGGQDKLDGLTDGDT